MRANKRARREAKELFRGCAVNGVLDENRVRQTVQHVVAAGRHDSPAIVSHFCRLLKLELARRTATIESATPLPADLRVAVEAGLTRLYGPGLTTAFAYRPALVGGLRIQVGCDVYDGSVRARLDTLQESF
jgi:F-type H+-transporting ATPase subunit delta